MSNSLDIALLTRFVVDCGDDLLAYLARCLRCRTSAADLRQETYLRLYTGPAAESAEHLYARALRIAHHLVIDHRRKEVVRLAWQARQPDTPATARAQCLDWQARSPAHLRAFAKAELLWSELGQAAAQDLPKPERRRGRRAGLVVTVLVCALGYTQLGRLTDLWQSDHRTAIGEQQTVRLPDGTIVLLDTDTAIGLDFDASRRRVRLLHGQALFTVAKDTARRFEVEAGSARIRALGTVFAVAVRDEAVSVTVEEHAVRVELEGSGPAAATVRAGQKLMTSPGRGLRAPEPADLGALGAWQRGRFAFKGRPWPKWWPISTATALAISSPTTRGSRRCA